MSKHFLFRFGICMFIFGICLYSYLDKQNELTSLKMKVFSLQKEIITMKEQNRMLLYEIDQFEHPAHLMELVRSPEYRYLKQPLLREILTLEEGMVHLNIPQKQEKPTKSSLYKTVAVGAQ